MKNKLKIIVSVISFILICSVLLPFLWACTPTETDTTGTSNNPDSGEQGENPVENEVADIYTSKEIADAIMAAYAPEDIPEGTAFQHFFSGAEEGSENYLSPAQAGLLINGSMAEIKEFDYLEDFAFHTPVGNHIFEVDVLKIKKGEEANLESVKELFTKRMKRKDNGDIRNYVQHEVPLIDNAKIINAGNYVILLATSDNSKGEAVINDMIKSGVKNDSSLSNDTTEEQSPAPTTEYKPVSLDEVVNIEPEILFDLELFTTVNQVTDPEPDPSQPRRTAVPSVTVKKYSHNTSFIVGGKCEVGAMIRVTGGTEEVYTSSDIGSYLVEVPFAEEGTTTLKLTAELDGKSPSFEITFIIKPQTDVDLYDKYGIYGTVIGYNFMTYVEDCMPDYLGTNLINDAEIAALTQRTQTKIKNLRDKGCNAEIIYLLAPNTVRIWPENVPMRYTENKNDTLVRQWKEGVIAGGATVLDLTDLMMSHKNDEFKIWHKTDTHWTEYGAMLGYYELMNYIAQKFPDAAPRPRSDFEPYTKEANFGDIFNFLELNISDLKETSAFVKFNFEPPIFNDNYDTGHPDLYNGNSVCLVHNRVEFSHTTESNVAGVKLPKAYFFRDSFEGPLHAFYTDRFSSATFKSMWDYNFNATEIAKENPDYVIYIISERNIKNVLYN